MKLFNFSFTSEDTSILLFLIVIIILFVLNSINNNKGIDTDYNKVIDTDYNQVLVPYEFFYSEKSNQVPVPDQSVHAPVPDQSVHAPALDHSVHAPIESVHAPVPDQSVNAPTPNESVHAPVLEKPHSDDFVGYDEYDEIEYSNVEQKQIPTEQKVVNFNYNKEYNEVTANDIMEIYSSF